MNFKATTVYDSAQRLQALKKKLRKRGKKLTEWFRDKVTEELEGKK